MTPDRGAPVVQPDAQENSILRSMLEGFPTFETEAYFQVFVTEVMIVEGPHMRSIAIFMLFML